MYTTIILYFAILVMIRSSDMDFAYYNGSLYASLYSQFEDRGDQTLYLMLQITQGSMTPLPNLIASMNNLKTDLRVDGTFNYWRPPGTNHPIFPDWDWLGWAASFIAPYPAIADEFIKQGPPWEQRSNNLFWTGTNLSAIRSSYIKCSQDHSERIKVSVVKREALLGTPPLPFLKPKHGIKKAVLDLRKLLGHRFLIYLPGSTWSTSLKRIVAAGATVFKPLRPHYESITDIILKDCHNCFLYYNHDNLCSSLINILNKITDVQAKGYAERLSRFVSVNFNISRVREFALRELIRYAASHPFPKNVIAKDDKLYFPSTNLTLDKVTCASIKKSHASHIGPDKTWQIDEWFDDECDLRSKLSYLSYVPI